MENDVLQTAVQGLWRRGAMPEALLERLAKAQYQVKRQAQRRVELQCLIDIVQYNSVFL